MLSKTIKPILFFILVLTVFLNAQTSHINLNQQNLFQMTPSGSSYRGLLGFNNPAMAAANHGFNSYFYLSDLNGKFSSPKHWGFFTGFPGLSFGMMHHEFDHFNSKEEFTNYKISMAGGSPFLKMGISYGWTQSKHDFDYDDTWSIGALVRPNRFLSIGSSANFFNQDVWNAQADLSIRPLGQDKITLFGEYIYQSSTPSFEEETSWNVGAMIQPLTGIYFSARYYENDFISVGTHISLGSTGFSAHQISSDDGNLDQKIYGFRIGASDPTFIHETLEKKSAYTILDLSGRMKYQRYLLFDDNTKTLKSTLNVIKSAKEDPRVRGILLKLTDASIPAELIWEIRTALEDFKQSGKKVIAYSEYFAISLYHLASVADRIIMDPEGMLILQGYAMGRTFYADMFEKLGIGFDELRFFKYKSAAESFARNEMSKADKEQRTALIEGQFKLVQEDICQSRQISKTTFMNMVNEDFVFNTEQAINQGLVDTVGRWSNIEELIENWEGKSKSLMPPAQLASEILPAKTWEPPAKVAIVYATGVCAMNTGIRARVLEKTFLNLAKRSDVKAIVFRVDSPGGDAMASDIVAEALKKCTEKKPVVVSQGSVAASGGYWISMYADTILAGPNTITGSIGVIAAWLWDKNLGDKVGMHSDYTQVGDHADLTIINQFPLIGLGLPHRKLSTEERARIEDMIKHMYTQFKTKVATGRSMSVEDVEEVAQGRVWTGIAGKDNGLVDKVADLETAIQIAKTMAGISTQKDLDIIELPFKGLINPDLFSFNPLGMQITNDPVIEYIKWMSAHSGRPMPLSITDIHLEPNQ